MYVCIYIYLSIEECVDVYVHVCIYSSLKLYLPSSLPVVPLFLTKSSLRKQSWLLLSDLSY